MTPGQGLRSSTTKNLRNRALHADWEKIDRLSATRVLIAYSQAELGIQTPKNPNQT